MCDSIPTTGHESATLRQTEEKRTRETKGVSSGAPPIGSRRGFHEAHPLVHGKAHRARTTAMGSVFFTYWVCVC